jgi:hypothetical protein
MLLKSTTGLNLKRSASTSQEEIAGMQVGAKLATAKANASDAQQQEAELRMGIDVAKERKGPNAAAAKKLKETPRCSFQITKASLGGITMNIDLLKYLSNKVQEELNASKRICRHGQC